MALKEYLGYRLAHFGITLIVIFLFIIGIGSFIFSPAIGFVFIMIAIIVGFVGRYYGIRAKRVVPYRIEKVKTQTVRRKKRKTKKRKKK